ncbi:MAG: penicillin-binding protein activator LpoB [Candidatus Amoebophilus sp.]
MEHRKIFSYLILLFLTLVSTECGSIKRISTSQVTDLSGRWNDTDARLVAEEMTQDVIKRPWRPSFISIYQRQPILVVGDILNKSHEHIDAEPFIKDIERELINTQSVRIVTHGAFREKVRKERQDQQDTASTEVQKKLGRELGADFMLFGTINAIVDTKAEGKHRVVFYQVNLELADLATNEIVWIGDKKIKKYIRK